MTHAGPPAGPEKTGCSAQCTNECGLLSFQARPAQPARNAQAVFESLDIDHDGSLSISELQRALAKFGLSQIEIEQLFSLLDANADGKVDQGEFIAGFDKYEALEKGGVSSRELLRVWAGGKPSNLASKVSSVRLCPVQCCPVQALKVGLLPDEPPRVVFIGVTGSGKSSLCTALTGQDKTKGGREASTFRIGKGAKSETTVCSVGEHWWLGEESQGTFKCIDTPGLNDSEGDDEHHMNSIIETMKQLEYVNAIVLVLNGTDPRFSLSLQEAISKFEMAFCGHTPGKVLENFYDNLIICFQRWKRNEDAVAEREEAGITEEETAQEFCNQFREKFPHCRNRAHELRCVFVDSHDRDQKRKAEHLLVLKQAVPKDVFRTGDLEQIVPRLTGYDAATQTFVQASEIIPMKPRLLDDRVKVIKWHISPTLPVGLEISSDTGTISGTPQLPSPPVSYTIVAESQGGKSKPCEIPQIEIKLSNDEVQTTVLKFKKIIESKVQSTISDYHPDGSDLDPVLSSLEETIRDSVCKAKNELEKQYANMTQLEELLEKVAFAGSTMKTNFEIKLRKRYEQFARKEHAARLELERSDHEVQRMLLACTEDYTELSRLVQHLASLDPATGSKEAITLEKAQKWLEDIKPTPCSNSGCPHIGLYRNHDRHKASCLFALHLMPHSAVLTSASDSCSSGFDLIATVPTYEEYSGTFDPGPCQYIDDDEDNWFHHVDRSNQRIIRVKYAPQQHWVLTCWEGPDTETEILAGSGSRSVDEASFEGFTVTPKPRLSWAENYPAAALDADSIKLIYFGGMWCPYCPPFTKKLKVFFDIVREVIGENAVQIIFASSDRNEDAMLEYYGTHHGDWFALPYQERKLKQVLSEKFGVNGIPSLHVVGNDGEEVSYFKDTDEGGKVSIGNEIRRIPDSKAEAKGVVIEIYKTLKENYMPSVAGFLGADYDKIVQSVKSNFDCRKDRPANLVGDLNDLKSGLFADAARGLRLYLKVNDDWKEEDHCTVQGIEAEVRRLRDCPACTELQASVLDQMNLADNASACRSLAEALKSAKAHEDSLRLSSLKALGASSRGIQDHSSPGNPSKQPEMGEDVNSERFLQSMNAVEEIRKGMDANKFWYYGCDKTMDWPQDAVIHAFGEFKQPMCEQCRRYKLDYTTIAADLKYVLYEASSEEISFNGVRDRDRTGERLQDFMLAKEATEARAFASTPRTRLVASTKPFAIKPARARIPFQALLPTFTMA